MPSGQVGRLGRQLQDQQAAQKQGQLHDQLELCHQQRKHFPKRIYQSPRASPCTTT